MKKPLTENDLRAALVSDLGVIAARSNLLAFAQRMIDGYQAPPHIREMLQAFEDVESGKCQRLLVSTYPGSGKSTGLQLFIPWYLGRHPKRRIIAASLNEDLAERGSRAAQSYFLEPQWPFAVKLSDKTTAARRWQTSEGGSLYALGTDSKILGLRGDLLMIDDAQNGVLSQLERDQLWEWYREKFLSRAEPNAPVIIVQQRFGVDDLPGRILDSEEGAAWRVINLPAIDDEGASTWPQRWPVAELLRKRAEIGVRAFESMYMCRPVPAEGAMYLTRWFEDRFDLRNPPAFKRVVCAVDSSAGKDASNERSDYTAIVKIGVTDSAYYIIDVFQERINFVGLCNRVASLADEQPAPDSIYVEDSSNATAMLQVLTPRTTLPVIPVKAIGSKEVRIESFTGLAEAGKIRLPESAPWLLDFERQLFRYPHVAHDDMIDAMALALARLYTSGSGGFSFFYGPGATADEQRIRFTDPARQAAFEEESRRQRFEENRPDATDFSYEDPRTGAKVGHLGQRNAFIMAQAERIERERIAAEAADDELDII